MHSARLITEDLLQSRSPVDAGLKLWRLWKAFDSGPAAMVLARFLISCFFVNNVYEDYEIYQFLASPDVQARAKLFPDRVPQASFPWVELLLLLPCAVLVVLGVQLLVTSSVLVADMIWDSTRLIWNGTWMLLIYGQRPNELMVKRLAILGCAAMVLAHGVRQSRQRSARPGVPITDAAVREEDRTRIGPHRSGALLAGRLLMTSLFLFVGINQVQRVLAHDWQLVRGRGAPKYGVPDGHDNNWLLLQLAFSLPFAMGYKTQVCSRLLAATLLLEAVTCWPFWQRIWPTWHYAAHVRSHFFTNLAVCGGLLLLQSFGAGRFTVDELIKKKGR